MLSLRKAIKEVYKVSGNNIVKYELNPGFTTEDPVDYSTTSSMEHWNESPNIGPKTLWRQSSERQDVSSEVYVKGYCFSL